METYIEVINSENDAKNSMQGITTTPVSSISDLIEQVEENESSGASNTAYNHVDQYKNLLKNLKGAACIDIIKQVLEAPSVYVFGELLILPNIIELENGPCHKYYSSLNLFAYGTYKQYMENPNDYIELTPGMKRKLQHLTIVSIAINNKCIPYKVLMKELEIKNLRDLEDLIIEAIYADIIHGKMDQKNCQLEIDYAIGRDIRPGDINKIAETLQEWCDSCESVLYCIEEQINRANSERAKRFKHKEHTEQEIINLRKALKAQLSDADEQMTSDSRESISGQENRKKSYRTKQHRQTGKSWFKQFT